MTDSGRDEALPGDGGDRASSRVSAGAATHREELTAALDPERFRREAHAAVELLADHLRHVTRDDTALVLPWQAPLSAITRFALPADDAAADARPTLPQLLAKLFAAS